MTELKPYQMRERWISKPLALFQLILIKTIHVMLRRRANNLVGRVKCLQDHVPPTLASACAPCHLSQHLKDSFPGERIGQIQSDVCEDDANQGDQRKIESFGEHLGTD